MKKLWLQPVLLMLLFFHADHPLPSQLASSSTAGQAIQERRREVASFELSGLHSPAQVAESIFVDAKSLPPQSRVEYFLDGKLIASTSEYPYKLQDTQTQTGFSLRALSPGTHLLHAEALVADQSHLRSKTIRLEVVASINDTFSNELSTYANQASAQSHTVEEVLHRTSTRGAILSRAELEVRRQALALYLNWNIDPSLDREQDQSQILLSLSPTLWSSDPASSQNAPLSLLFSRDAPFYQRIPQTWPRTPLPAGYIRQIQLNTVKDGDGLGYGQSVATLSDPTLTVTSEWPGNPATHRTFPFRIPGNWPSLLPSQPSGDLHMIFMDTATNSFVSTYKTSASASTGGPSANYSSSPTSLATLGDRGGSTAAAFAELPMLLQPGEATNQTQPIAHALGGSVARVWAARVYPASAWDTNVLHSVNSCTGSNVTNNGLVPYGGLIQLDPRLDLTALNLTLPALRILQAIQTYGYYVADFGCSDLDIYTAISEDELNPFGGLWGYNRNGIGVQNEIQTVLGANTLFIVVPLIKKQ